MTDATALWKELEEVRVIDYEGDTLNKQECIAILAAALNAREQETWEKAAKVVEGNRPVEHGNVFRAQREICTKIAEQFRAQAEACHKETP